VLKEAPDHHDADLVLKRYDLRREAVMRESLNAIDSGFWPRNAEEAVAVTTSKHPLNVAFRQTSGYWEMVFDMARHGIIHADFLVENNEGGLFLYAKVEPYLAQIRAATSPPRVRERRVGSGEQYAGEDAYGGISDQSETEARLEDLSYDR
jgi:hypothetical protein